MGTRAIRDKKVAMGTLAIRDKKVDAAEVAEVGTVGGTGSDDLSARIP